MGSHASASPLPDPAGDDAWLDALFARSGMARVLLDAQRQIVRANDAFARLLGSTPAALIGRSLDSLAHPDDPPPAGIDGPTPDQRRLRYLRGDGRAVWVDWTALPVALGGEAFTLGEAVDVTALVDAVRDRDERFRAIWMAAGDAMALSDAEGIVLEANPAYCALYGYRIEQVVGQSFTIIFPPEQRQWAAEQYRAIVQAGQVLPAYVSRIQRADGEMRVVESYAALVAIGGGQTGMLSMIRDITDRIRAEEARARLLEQEQREREAAIAASTYAARLHEVTAALATALTPDQVAEVILNQGITRLGAHAGTIIVPADDGTMLEVFRTIGYPPEIIARRQRFPLAARTPMTDAVRAGEPVLLESRSAMIEHYPALAATQEVFGDGAMAAFPLLAHGRVLGGLGLSFVEARQFGREDLAFMTSLVEQCAHALERARLYQDAERARAKAQDAVDLRDAFLSVAAHELKNPLAALLGTAQLMQRRLVRDGASPERDLRNLAAIADQATRMNQWITTLLDTSQLEAGQVRLDRAPLDLAALVERVLNELQPTLDHHTLALQRSPQALLISGDELRLTQVLQNLLGNAVKYSPQGGRITVRLAEREGQALVAVADEGIGIPAEIIPKLFRRFYRPDTLATRHIGGIGVGLYIVDEIVALHGGAVGVESEEGRGSTFTIRLPLLRPA